MLDCPSFCCIYNTTINAETTLNLNYKGSYTSESYYVKSQLAACFDRALTIAIFSEAPTVSRECYRINSQFAPVGSKLLDSSRSKRRKLDEERSDRRKSGHEGHGHHQSDSVSPANGLLKKQIFMSHRFLTQSWIKISS